MINVSLADISHIGVVVQGVESIADCKYRLGIHSGAFKGPKVPFFVMKSALFVQANVAVKTKLTSKVPFLFGNFVVFKKHFVKNVQFRYSTTRNFFFFPPTFAGKNF
jgi:hypothetical protein